MSFAAELSRFRTAVLYQAAPVPVVAGVSKPPKPGGYRDSSADIAYSLKASGQHLVLPVSSPDPRKDEDWSFPDTETGVLSAVQAGANVLWANTTLYPTHALVTLRDRLPANIRFIGQNPLEMEKLEDKAWINKWLAQGELEDQFPRSWLLAKSDKEALDKEIELPAVVKPVRGRGSYGVSVAWTRDELRVKAEELWQEGELILIEAYCKSEEITVTVMPPGEYEDMGYKSKHWALPVVTRFNHQNGIAPYNGVVAVTKNSRAITPAEHDHDVHYRVVQRSCEIVAERCKALAPIRIDGRRQEDGGPFYLFDVNMKPNATGVGRPGREDQASLVLIAAEAIGWDYPKLLRNILRQAQKIEDVVPSAK